jgi:hypothetical protein
MSTSGDEVRRRRVLEGWGGSAAAVEAVLAYGANRFDPAALPPPPVLPLPPEPHLEWWSAQAAAAGEAVFDHLRARLPQLRIPLRPGMSGNPAYAEVMRRGCPFDPAAFAGELVLERPAALHLEVHSDPAGDLPVLLTAHRPDFETLYRALACRSEPVVVNPAVNAQMIAGLINWDRVAAYRETWLAAGGNPGAWEAERARVAQVEPWHFFDRLVLACEYPYSGVLATDLGLALDEGQWLARSTVLRLTHEFTHYLTKRLYGVMSLNLLDEIIADCAGMTAALGTFRAVWFLRCLGLDTFPAMRPDGRVHTYRGDLDDAAFALLCALTVAAAQGLEGLVARHYHPAAHTRLVLALTRLTLESLADPRREDFFIAAWEAAGRLLEDCFLD